MLLLGAILRLRVDHSRSWMLETMSSSRLSGEGDSVCEGTLGVLLRLTYVLAQLVNGSLSFTLSPALLGSE